MKRILMASAVVFLAAGAMTGCCPKRVAAAKAQLTGDQITVSETIRFETGKATIDPASTGTLDEVAEIVKANPAITKMTIEGHTDSVGDAALNKQLSQDRADAVKSYLAGKGIEGDRMTAVGYGSEQPIASNDTDDGRAKNRRVAFKIAR
ncbi:MAG TPA: OmpA family protein [Anaeromyxobacteraceae bacterium]|nr:OmpA family protein [Anaeromyxobacteraceae bacterium]